MLVRLGGAGLALGAAGFALAGTATLSLTQHGPVPQTLTVGWGDTLEVRNADTVPHTLVSSHRELQGGVIQPGQAYTTSFTGRVHALGYRQTGGRSYSGKIVVDFSGRVTLKYFEGGQ